MRTTTCPTHPGIRIDKHPCYRCSPTLTNPDSRAAVGALYSVNPEGTAELMVAFPDGVFSKCQVLHEGVSTTRAIPADTADRQPSTSSLGGQVSLW